MNKTVVGIFQNYQEAKLVVHELLHEGVLRSDISIVANADSTDLLGGAQDLRRLTLPDGGQVMATGTLGDALTSPGAEIELAKFGISTPISRSYRDSIRGGKVLVAVQVVDERVDSVSALMNRYCSTALAGQPTQGPLEVTVPVVQEELQVGKREIQRGGVHVVSHVTKLPVEQSVRLREEHISIERHPVDRPLAPGDITAFQESTFEVRQHAEIAVVSKEARVVEEVVIGKTVTEHTQIVRDSVRRTAVVIESLPAAVI
jgi:uncharacterized protein (TIGR02271 family)